MNKGKVQEYVDRKEMKETDNGWNSTRGRDSDYSVLHIRDKYHPGDRLADDELISGNAYYQQQEINLSEETGEQVRYKIPYMSVCPPSFIIIRVNQKSFNEEGIVEGMAM